MADFRERHTDLIDRIRILKSCAAVLTIEQIDSTYVERRIAELEKMLAAHATLDENLTLKRLPAGKR